MSSKYKSLKLMIAVLLITMSAIFMGTTESLATNVLARRRVGGTNNTLNWAWDVAMRDYNYLVSDQAIDDIQQTWTETSGNAFYAGNYSAPSYDYVAVMNNTNVSCLEPNEWVQTNGRQLEGVNFKVLGVIDINLYSKALSDGTTTSTPKNLNLGYGTVIGRNNGNGTVQVKETANDAYTFMAYEAWASTNKQNIITKKQWTRHWQQRISNIYSDENLGYFIPSVYEYASGETNNTLKNEGIYYKNFIFDRSKTGKSIQEESTTGVETEIVNHTQTTNDLKLNISAYSNNDVVNQVIKISSVKIKNSSNGEESEANSFKILIGGTEYTKNDNIKEALHNNGGIFRIEATDDRINNGVSGASVQISDITATSTFNVYRGRIIVCGGILGGDQLRIITAGSKDQMTDEVHFVFDATPTPGEDNLIFELKKVGEDGTSPLSGAKFTAKIDVKKVGTSDDDFKPVLMANTGDPIIYKITTNTSGKWWNQIPIVSEGNPGYHNYQTDDHTVKNAEIHITFTEIEAPQNYKLPNAEEDRIFVLRIVTDENGRIKKVSGGGGTVLADTTENKATITIKNSKGDSSETKDDENPEIIEIIKYDEYGKRLSGVQLVANINSATYTRQGTRNTAARFSTNRSNATSYAYAGGFTTETFTTDSSKSADRTINFTTEVMHYNYENNYNSANKKYNINTSSDIDPVIREHLSWVEDPNGTKSDGSYYKYYDPTDPDKNNNAAKLFDTEYLGERRALLTDGLRGTVADNGLNGKDKKIAYHVKTAIVDVDSIKKEGPETIPYKGKITETETWNTWKTLLNSTYKNDFTKFKNAYNQYKSLINNTTPLRYYNDNIESHNRSVISRDNAEATINEKFSGVSNYLNNAPGSAEALITAARNQSVSISVNTAAIDRDYPVRTEKSAKSRSEFGEGEEGDEAYKTHCENVAKENEAIRTQNAKNSALKSNGNAVVTAANTVKSSQSTINYCRSREPGLRTNLQNYVNNIKKQVDIMNEEQVKANYIKYYTIRYIKMPRAIAGIDKFANEQPGIDKLSDSNEPNIETDTDTLKTWLWDQEIDKDNEAFPSYNFGNVPLDNYDTSYYWLNDNLYAKLSEVDVVNKARTFRHT